MAKPHQLIMFDCCKQRLMLSYKCGNCASYLCHWFYVLCTRYWAATSGICFQLPGFSFGNVFTQTKAITETLKRVLLFLSPHNHHTSISISGLPFASQMILTCQQATIELQHLTNKVSCRASAYRMEISTDRSKVLVKASSTWVLHCPQIEAVQQPFVSESQQWEQQWPSWIGSGKAIA